MFAKGPKWNSESIQRLGGVVLAVVNKLNGYDNMEPIRDHFNRVMREVKCVCTDPKNANGFDPESYNLAKYMCKSKLLKQIFMKINTIDDVDKDLANGILQILEPAYARSEPIKKLTV